MIRINLLPRDEKAQREIGIPLKAGELVLPIGMLGAVALVLAGTVMSQRMTIASLSR